MAVVTQFQDVAAPSVGRDVITAGGDQGVEVPVVLAEDQLVDRGCTRGFGDGGDQSAQSATQGVGLGVIQAGDQFGMAPGPQHEPAGDLHSGSDLGCPERISENHRSLSVVSIAQIKHESVGEVLIPVSLNLAVSAPGATRSAG